MNKLISGWIKSTQRPEVFEGQVFIEEKGNNKYFRQDLLDLHDESGHYFRNFYPNIISTLLSCISCSSCQNLFNEAKTGFIQPYFLKQSLIFSKDSFNLNIP